MKKRYVRIKKQFIVLIARDKEELEVLFLNSKNQKNLVCYGCWDKIIRTFGKTKQEEKAIIKKDRLKSVE